MQGIVAVFIAAAVGGVLAVGGVVGLVSTQSATPPPVSSPYVTYGS